MEYIHLFNTISECDTYYNGESYKEPCASFTLENNEIKYNKVAAHDYSKDYFTLKAITSGNFGVVKRGYEQDTLKYRINGGEWVVSSSDVSNLPLNADDEIEVSFNPSHNMEIYGGNFVSFTGQFEIYGNIFSLMYGDDFESYSTMKMVFAGMFENNKNIISAENLILPATTMIERAYHSMFHGCSSLTTAPELPATTLANYCYSGMFQGCTSLTTAPELPVTTLVEGCYKNMFQNCTSLTTAPVLPAITLAQRCYQNMFYNCESLNYVKCLATDISANGCTDYWVNGVSSTGTFIKDSSMSDWTTGDNGIPTGWTVEDAS